MASPPWSQLVYPVAGRQINLAPIASGASLYSVAREWFRNDPVGAAAPSPSKRARLDPPDGGGDGGGGAGAGADGATVLADPVGASAAAPSGAATLGVVAASVESGSAEMEAGSAGKTAGSVDQGEGGSNNGGGGGGGAGASYATSSVLPVLPAALPFCLPRPPPSGNCTDDMVNSLAGAHPKLLLAGHVAYWREVRRWWCAHYKRRAARYKARLEARGMAHLVLEPGVASGRDSEGEGKGEQAPAAAGDAEEREGRVER